MLQAGASGDAILAFLDQTSANGEFPLIDDPYVAPIDQRVSGLRAKGGWALVVELIGFHTRIGGVDGIFDAVYCWRGGVSGPNAFGVEYRHGLVSPAPDTPLFQRECLELVDPSCHRLLLGRMNVELGDHRTMQAAFSGGLGGVVDRLHVVDMLREVVPDYRDELFLDARELIATYCAGGAVSFSLDDWGHPKIRMDKVAALDMEAIKYAMLHPESAFPLPDIYETPSVTDFAEFCRALCDPSGLDESKLTARPNAHWSNWLGAGTY